MKISSLTASAALVARATFAAPSALAAEIEWEPDVYPSGNIYPSVIIGTARVDPEEELFPIWKGRHLGDKQGLVGATVSGLTKGDTVELVVDENDVMKESRVTGRVSRTKSDDLMITQRSPTATRPSAPIPRPDRSTSTWSSS